MRPEDADGAPGPPDPPEHVDHPARPQDLELRGHHRLGLDPRELERRSPEGLRPRREHGHEVPLAVRSLLDVEGQGRLGPSRPAPDLEVALRPEVRHGEAPRPVPRLVERCPLERESPREREGDRPGGACVHRERRLLGVPVGERPQRHARPVGALLRGEDVRVRELHPHLAPGGDREDAHADPRPVLSDQLEEAGVGPAPRDPIVDPAPLHALHDGALDLGLPVEDREALNDRARGDRERVDPLHLHRLVVLERLVDLRHGDAVDDRDVRGVPRDADRPPDLGPFPEDQPGPPLRLERTRVRLRERSGGRRQSARAPMTVPQPGVGRRRFRRPAGSRVAVEAAVPQAGEVVQGLAGGGGEGKKQEDGNGGDER